MYKERRRWSTECTEDTMRVDRSALVYIQNMNMNKFVDIDTYNIYIVKF